MNDPVQEYLGKASTFTMTKEERAAGRMGLQAHMQFALTEGEKADARRVLQHAVFADPVPSFTWSLFRIPARLPAIALSVLVLLGASGGGIVYAAEFALPGDVLYSVKVHMNEAFVAGLQATPEDRARWAVSRLERRMAEYNALKASGRLDERIDAELALSMEESARDVEVTVERLPAAAAERAAIRTAVRSVLGANEEGREPTDDELRRAARVNRVLKALKERNAFIEGSAAPAVILPVPTKVSPAAKSERSQKSSAASERTLLPLQGEVVGEGESSLASSLQTSSVRGHRSDDRDDSEGKVPDAEEIDDLL